jgi:hypothetical protein
MESDEDGVAVDASHHENNDDDDDNMWEAEAERDPQPEPEVVLPLSSTNPFIAAYMKSIQPARENTCGQWKNAYGTKQILTSRCMHVMMR